MRANNKEPSRRAATVQLHPEALRLRDGAAHPAKEASRKGFTRSGIVTASDMGCKVRSTLPLAELLIDQVEQPLRTMVGGIGPLDGGWRWNQETRFRAASLMVLEAAPAFSRSVK